MPIQKMVACLEQSPLHSAHLFARHLPKKSQRVADGGTATLGKAAGGIIRWVSVSEQISGTNSEAHVSPRHNLLEGQVIAREGEHRNASGGDEGRDARRYHGVAWGDDANRRSIVESRLAMQERGRIVCEARRRTENGSVSEPRDGEFNSNP